MADGGDDDDDDKPLDPSDKRLNDALAQGNQPFAREAPVVAMLVGFVCFAGLFAVPLTLMMADRLALLFGQAGDIRIESQREGLVLMRQMVTDITLAMGPALLVFMVCGVLASVLQNPPRLIADRITPKMRHVSPMAGFKRIFGKHGLIEFARAFAKLAIVLVVLVGVLFAARHDVAVTMMAEPGVSLATMRSIAASMAGTVLGASLILLAADLLWSRREWLSQMRMTHQEMKDEMKENDGDPHVKQKRLAIQRQRMTRMMTEVPKASVIITNPTHFAIALKYDAAGAGVPQVIAKGQDHIAQAIKALAAEHNVPQVEDVPLARALYRSVEVGQFIPREFFEAVAQIVHLITTRKAGPSGVILRRNRFSADAGDA